MDLLGFLFAIIIPVFLVSFGLLSNTIVFLVFRRKRFKKTVSRNFFCLMSITESIALSTLIPFNLPGYNVEALTFSEYSCKIFTFSGYFFPAVSSWLLVLINIERFISVKHRRIIVFGETWFQILILSILFVWNFIIYFCFTYFTGLVDEEGNLVNTSSYNSTDAICGQVGLHASLTLNWVDVVNSIVLPLFFMLFCSIAIVHSIYLTRRQILRNYLTKDLKRLRRDVRFSLVIISLSVAFFVFNFPVNLSGLLYDAIYLEMPVIVNLLIELTFYLQYIFNIFVYWALNAKFRMELRLMFGIKIKKKKKHVKFRKVVIRVINV